MNGAFIIPRNIFENPIWAHNTDLKLFLLILGKAIYADEGYDIGGTHLNKGQWLRSYRNLQSDLEFIENNAVHRPGLATIKKSIDKLVTYGLIRTCTIELGTLFTVVDYAKMQDFDTHKKKTQNSVRNIAKNKEGTTPERRPNNNDKVNQEDHKNIYVLKFENLWNAYPKKRNKEQARTAFEKLMKAGVDFDLIMSGVKNYAQNCSRDGTELKFIAHASTFLNQKRYAEYQDEQTELLEPLLGEGVTVLI